jgi:enoyl-CoA hydratase/carnithine racemase
MTAAYDALTHVQVAVDDGVAWAVVDHPPMNLWDRELTPDIVGLIGAFESDAESRVLVLTSANPEFFIAHADVGMIIQMDPAVQGEEGAPAPINLLLGRLHEVPKISIALVRGIARGGGSEIALACDLRFAIPHAVFAQPEVALGIIPGAGGTQRLTRLVGRARALEIVVGCDDVSAEEAAAIGYVNRVIPDDRIDQHVRGVATRIAAMPPNAVAGAKRAVDAAFGDPTAGYAAEASAFRAALADPVARERMQRFLELGGQTPEIERGNLADLLDRLNDPHRV